MAYPLKRKDLEITDVNILKKILKSTKYVTIALSRDNKPYLVSLSHGYNEKRNCIYFHCAGKGKKLDYLKSNNVVWGQALLDHGYFEGECDHLFASVHFFGKVTFIEELDEKHLAMECMVRQLDKNPETLLPECLDSKKLRKLTMGRIDIYYITGKKSKEVKV